MNGKVAERPQHMFMRVAIGIHQEDIDAAIETYHLMSETVVHPRHPHSLQCGNTQSSDLFLFSITNEERQHRRDLRHPKTMRQISQAAGGIGLSIHNIRATGSYIRGTGGISNGIVPMLRVFNDTARYVDQGGGKRKGSFAIYLEPWHADILPFLDLKKNHGKEELRTRDLFTALWIPDLFMKRVEENGDWSLFCPNEAPGLI